MSLRPERAVSKRLKEKGLRLAVAESCTGGLIGHMLTNLAGSSKWFMGGVIAYDDEVKKGLLGVKPGTLEKHGAVSVHTAEEMARGVKKKLKADVGLAITGVAGPGGGTSKKPVGTVFIAVLNGKKVHTRKLKLKGTRTAIKKSSAIEALITLEKLLR